MKGAVAWRSEESTTVTYTDTTDGSDTVPSRVRYRTGHAQASTPSASMIYLAGSAIRGWTFVQPLPVRIERDEEGWYVASDDQFHVYGQGPDTTIALHDYVASLQEYYQLVERDARTDVPSGQQLAHLQSYLWPLCWADPRS